MGGPGALAEWTLGASIQSAIPRSLPIEPAAHQPLTELCAWPFVLEAGRNPHCCVLGPLYWALVWATTAVCLAICTGSRSERPLLCVLDQFPDPLRPTFAPFSICRNGGEAHFAQECCEGLGRVGVSRSASSLCRHLSLECHCSSSYI